MTSAESNIAFKHTINMFQMQC